MRIATFFLFLGLFLQVQAQMKQPDPTVFIFVGDSIFPMNVITSQTELKKGWDIQGINVGRKIKRYFSGAQARQTTGRQPKFAIYPKTQDLNDYALIRLKERRGFRYLPASEFKDCDYTRVELHIGGSFSKARQPIRRCQSIRFHGGRITIPICKIISLLGMSPDKKQCIQRIPFQLFFISKRKKL